MIFIERFTAARVSAAAGTTPSVLKSALEELKAEIDTEIYQVFYMLTIQQRPVAEIAEITRRTPNNIYIIRHRCLQKLRAIIAAYRRRGDSELALHSHKNSPAN